MKFVNIWVIKGNWTSLYSANIRRRQKDIKFSLDLCCYHGSIVSRLKILFWKPTHTHTHRKPYASYVSRSGRLDKQSQGWFFFAKTIASGTQQAIVASLLKHASISKFHVACIGRQTDSNGHPHTLKPAAIHTSTSRFHETCVGISLPPHYRFFSFSSDANVETRVSKCHLSPPVSCGAFESHRMKLWTMRLSHLTYIYIYIHKTTFVRENRHREREETAVVIASSRFSTTMIFRVDVTFSRRLWGYYKTNSSLSEWETKTLPRPRSQLIFVGSWSHEIHLDPSSRWFRR